jgi:hypothetical protein
MESPVLLAAENNYPLLEVIWTIIVFFAWVIWIWTVISILSDVFRRQDIGGGTKALWTFIIILLPFLGVLVYLISQGRGMAERNVERMQTAQKMYEQHIREVASSSGGGGAAGEIASAKALLASGDITQEEFDQLKRKALA